MNLKYRGVSYDYQASTVELIETEDSALFLGQAYRLKRLVNVTTVARVIPVTYRGQPLQNLRLTLVN